MFGAFFSYLFGTYSCSVQSEDRLRVVNLLKDISITPIKPHSDEDSSYRFSFFAPFYTRVRSILDDKGIIYSLSPLKGFPNILLFLRRRPGILFGLIILFIVTYCSSRTVWGFDVIGNSTVPDDEILLMLDDLGCGYGDYIPSMDLDLIHAKFLALNEDISWIAVNFNGNFANVEVIETRKGVPSTHPDGIYANLIASEDGQIYLVKTKSGRSVAEAGSIVKKGEILVSGVIDVREDRVRYEYAEGEVLAYVPRTIEVEIPFESARKAYTGREIEDKSIKIFKKIINLFTKGGIEYSVYDKIIDERQIRLFGVFPLPVWTRTVTAREYDYVTDKLSLKESAALAAAELRYRLDDILEDAELISNKVSYEITEEAVIMRFDMICLADISDVCEFTVFGERRS